MAAIVQVSRSASPNRRTRVRQKVHVPAYATFSGASAGEMLELYEVLDISECGLALQCSLPVEVNQTVALYLDLAEGAGRISASARVVWTDVAGRVGLSLPVLTDSDAEHLQEWLFLNAIAAAANAEVSVSPSQDSQSALPRQNYTDILSAASAVQRQAESLGSDLEAVLSLIVSRSQSLLRTSGAAIALDRGRLDRRREDEKRSDESKDRETADHIGENNKDDIDQEPTSRSMICRASAGPGAPPVGMSLQVGSGFSGECVRTGELSRCDDTETDERVDRQSCRALGIRSILAAPVRVREKVIGLLEVFSAHPGAFSENDCTVLQRFAETIAGAVSQSRAQTPSAPPAPPAVPFSPSPGSVLFAHPPEEISEKDLASNKDSVGGIRLPRAHLYLLLSAAATIFLALGFLLAPWIQEKLQARGRNGEQTVLASSKPPTDIPKPSAFNLSIDSTNLPQLRELAARGIPAAENALGLFYSAGDDKQGIKRDENEAARWFTKAAEHGNVPAQSKLGSLYWSGRGVPKDDNRAYFWTVLARASGDDASKVLAPFIATRLTLAQRAAIEQQAEQWLQQHESPANPVASR